MDKIISVVFRKGGTGKTALSVNLAFAIATFKKTVLLIDTDVTYSATKKLQKAAEVKLSLSDLLEDPTIDPAGAVLPISLKYRGRTVRFDFIPSDDKLEAKESSLTELIKTNDSDYLTHIPYMLSKLKDKYDYIVIDTHPSAGYITTSAIVASTHLIIPTKVEMDDILELPGSIERYENIRDNYNPSLKTLGIVPTCYVQRTKNSVTCYEVLRTTYNSIFLPYPIPYNTDIKSSSVFVSENPEHPASLAYLKIAEVVLNAK